MDIQIVDYPILLAFWLSFARWAALLVHLPIFDQIPLPTMVKVLATILLTYAFFPVTGPEVLKDIQYLGVDHFWLLTIYEVVVGLVIGILVKAIMDLYVAAGTIVSQQVGLAAINYYDPSAQMQVGAFEKIIQYTVLVMLLSTGVLTVMFQGGVDSFLHLHVQDLSRLATTPAYFLDLFKFIFLSALMLASPLIFINLLMNCLLGIISRTVPQMYIIKAGLEINIGAGLIVFVATSDEFFQVAYQMYVDKLGDWINFVS